MNVYIVGSPWHLTLSLAMNKDDKDCIILIEKISEASVNTIIGMCKRFDVRYEVIGDIESIRFANLGIKNLFTFTAEVRTKLSSIELRTKQLISSNVINKVFYFNIYSPVTRAQLKHYFIAGIETVRVEDGICDYFNFQFLYYPLYKKIMKKTLLPRKNMNNPQIKAYSDAVKKGMKSQHVIPAEDGWAVKRAGSSRSSKIFKSKREAIKHATKISRNSNSGLFIHSLDGDIKRSGAF